MLLDAGATPDHRRPQRAPRGPARKRRRRPRQGRGRARRRARRHPVRRRKRRRCATGGDAVAHVCAQLDASLPDAPPTRRACRSPMSRSGRSAPARSPATADIGEMHAALRQRLVAAYRRGRRRRCASSTAARSRPANAAEIFAVPDVDGALVGGASLTAADFLPIVEAAAARGRKRVEFRAFAARCAPTPVPESARSCSPSCSSSRRSSPPASCASS